MSHDPFNRPLGTAPGEAYGPQEEETKGAYFCYVVRCERNKIKPMPYEEFICKPEFLNKWVSAYKYLYVDPIVERGFTQKLAAGETWAASIAAVLCFVGFVAYLFFYR